MTFPLKFLIFIACIVVIHCRSLHNSENVLDFQDSNCSCDWRYFKHYETKGCTPEVIDSCGCPEKFTCPSNETQQTTIKVCIYQNKEYKIGSKILSSDSCQVCRCLDGVPPYISCIPRECPEISAAPGQNCHLIYKENKCCPVSVECFEGEAEVPSNNTCEYNNRFYPFGSRIYAVDDPCQTCICDENWNNGDNSSCYQQECIFEKNKAKLIAGCIPVYHESRCCPVEFYCPSSHNLSYSVIYNNESSDNTSYDKHCTFADHFYAPGEELFIGNPCVKCTCDVPPDLTCVHKACPPSPSEGNCYANYNSGECCPTYECMLGDIDLHTDGCPTPLCADSSCRIEIPPGHDCPTCVCGENGSELEHNNLEQAQQPNQNLEQMEQIQVVFEPRESSDDYSEDELQIMPVRMQADGEHIGEQVPMFEKIIMPEFEHMDQYPEALRELEESSVEDIYSTEAVHVIAEGNEMLEDDSSTHMPEPYVDEFYNKTVSNESEAAFEKELDGFHEPIDDHILEHRESSEQEILELNEGAIEREAENPEEIKSDFSDEMKNIENRILNENRTIINEIFSINHVVEVPPGCPTPMCEGPWCKIGILPGEKCPTCICKRHSEP